MPMKYKVYKKLTSWIAVFAVLMASFAPVVSHALALKNTSSSSVGQTFEELCTSQGIKFIVLNKSFNNDFNKPVPANTSPALHLEHCAYCSLIADKAFLPTSNNQFGLILISSYSRYFIEYESQVLQAYFYASPQPQAPPRFI